MIARKTLLMLLAAALAVGCGFKVKGPEFKDTGEKDTVAGDAVVQDAAPLPDVEAEDQTQPDVPAPDVPSDPGSDEASGCKSDAECDDGDECTSDKCDTDSGECFNIFEPVLCPDCLEEGAQFEAEDPTGVCCEDLEPIPEVQAENGECFFLDCLCWVCADCGNHYCDEGENHCNCPDDCDEPENECKEEGGSCLPPGVGNGECPKGMYEEKIPGCPMDDLCCFEAEVECVPEGVNKGVGGDAPPCCDGLVSIPVANYQPETGVCAQVSGLAVCSQCFNHVCEEEWENPCNCEQDCPWPKNECFDMDGECLESEGIVPGPDICPPGFTYLDVAGCDEGQVCCQSGGPCLGEGELYETGGGEPPPPCCEGLVGVPQSQPFVDEGEPCGTVPGVNVCTDCGDGHCATWESSCNCEEDCPPVVNPVFCFGDNVCGFGSYCKFPTGDCGLTGSAGECVAVPEICSVEPLQECGCDNTTYPNECFMEQSKVSKLYAGQCQPQNCITEGEAYDSSENPGGCCEGLSSIGIAEPDESGGCTGSIGTKKICAFCPNGQCGSGENYCNCPDDCGDEPPPLSCTETGGMCQAPLPGTTDCVVGAKIDNPGCEDGLICCKM